MDVGLQNKVIIVSGGAKGIGEGITRLLASEGAYPVIIGRSKADNEKLVGQLRKAGFNADAVTAELTNPDACAMCIKQVAEKYGRIDGLVNNAGVQSLSTRRCLEVAGKK
jgi:L-fucose dehydrogenase